MRQVGRSASDVILNWALHMGGAAATQPVKAKHRRSALRAHDIPLSTAQLAMLNRLGAMYHTQAGTSKFPIDGEFGGFTCGAGTNNNPHVLFRPLCHSPPYRIAPPTKFEGDTKYHPTRFITW